ncbi:hypothetical protein OXX79_007653 [Metschnikowia pulcherrima]
MSEKNSSGSRGSGLGGVFKSFTKSLKPASGRVPVVVNAKVVGGASDMQKLLYRLQHDALPLRVSAATEITKSIETFSVSSIPEIWYLARDLCDKRLASAVRRVGLTLMISCIEHDSMEVSNRLMYYRDILAFCNVTHTELDSEFDLFFRALTVLTDQGKEIHDLCIYNQDRDWLQFMKQSWTALTSSFAEKRRQDKATASEQTLIVSFDEYLRNCLKFNSSIMDEHFISSVLRDAFQVSSATEGVYLLQSMSELIQSVAFFAHVPIELYGATTLFLCASAPLSGELLQVNRETMGGMFSSSSHHALEATISIFRVPELQDLRGLDLSHVELKQGPDHKCLLTALGALSMLESMLLSCCSNDSPKEVGIQYDVLYDGLLDCSRLKIPIINSGVLRILDRLFAMPEDAFSNHSGHRLSAVFPFHTWFLSSRSVFSLLSILQIENTQDESYWSSICLSLHDRYVSKTLTAPEEKLVDLFLLHPQFIDESIVTFVLKFYKEKGLCTVSNPFWRQNCQTLLTAFYFQPSQVLESQSLRMKTLALIKEGHEKSFLLTDDDSIGLEGILSILRSIFIVEENGVSHELLHSFVHDYLRVCSFDSFEKILDALKSLCQRKKISEPVYKQSHPKPSASSANNSKISPSAGSFSTNLDLHSPSEHFCIEVIKCLGSLFIELTSKGDSRKVSALYDFLIDVLTHGIDQKLFRLSLFIIRVLIRLRSTSEGFLYFCDPTDMKGMASTFRRNTLDDAYVKNTNHWWNYPENSDYLPKEYFNSPGRKVLTSQRARSSLGTSASVFLDLSKWLQIVIAIVGDCVHWELYSYTLAHFCSQLFNLSLFQNMKDHISTFQHTICEQIMFKFSDGITMPPPESDTNKSDLQVALVRMLSSLIGYHDLLERQEEENLIKSLLFGLGSWQKTAIPCIHMLTICCYEISESMKKYLIPILTKLQTGVSSVFASSSALEFLMALTHVPLLTSNFTADEFRQVFAICFRYIEHALDAKSRGFKDAEYDTEDYHLSHGIDAEVDAKASTQSVKLTPLFYQYTLVTSYAVIMRWFLKIELTERSQISSFVVKNLISCSGAKGIDELDDMTIAYLDAITRFTYSDIPLSTVTNITPGSRGSLCRWLIGHAVAEINTDVYDGMSTITLRRPCGLSAFDLTLNQTMVPNYELEKPKHALMLSSHLLLQLFKPLDQGAVSKPLALLDDSSTDRAIKAFDRIPVLSHHKAGIIYVGPGQKDETEILANTGGSLAYHQFLDGLGSLVRLKSCKSSYVGGLDKENGIDGEYAYFWSDALTHLVYHTTTLMPNGLNDKYFAMKKRHIGNNYVNVFFDESGLPFNFNVVRSQFNFLNIVLTPHTSGEIDDTKGPKFYKVITYRRSGVPGIFSTTHFKLVSLKQLPRLIRNMIIVSNSFSDVWHNSVEGKFTTNWELRVRHLNTLRRKTIESLAQIEHEKASKSVPGAQSGASKNTAMSFLEQLQPQRAGADEQQRKEPSVSQFATGGEKDLYSLLEFNSYT